ncbi:hypothetical protein HID58_052432 [Brassica napus]|uniref:Uncharacterized protein n=1 Tax=Brassica napus TaxID=3708 RepID=A0ABQ8ACK7_BRANA|nr:hypothetical protein HID58_052432 [Brassica napus]
MAAVDSLQLNALSLPTWAVHVSSVVECFCCGFLEFLISVKLPSSFCVKTRLRRWRWYVNMEKERVMSHGKVSHGEWLTLEESFVESKKQICLCKNIDMQTAERCTYGERILGSSSERVQSNITRYFSDPQYYFKVNDQYVRNKLKVVLFPFLHRPLSKTSSCFASNDQGHWARISEPVGGRLSYKPPIYDINAPDLYIPFMAFGTYVVLLVFHWDLMESKFLYMTLCISLSVLSLRGSVIDGH